MRHQRDEVIERTVKEFEQLDILVSNLTNEEWNRFVPRPETKDPWTVKDTLAHITHWKADVVRSALGQHQAPELQGLMATAANHLIYLRWHDRPPQEVLTWHWQVQRDVLAALQSAPDKWFKGKERKDEWPYDLDGHSTYHRVRDIERVLKTKPKHLVNR